MSAKKSPGPDGFCKRKVLPGHPGDLVYLCIGLTWGLIGKTWLQSKFWWNILWFLLEKEEISLLRSCCKAIFHSYLREEFHKAIFIHLCGFSWVQDFSNWPSHPFFRIQLEVSAEIYKTAWLYFRGYFSMIVTYCLYCLSSGLWFNNICVTRDLWIWDCVDHASIICVSYKLSEFIWSYCLLIWLIYRSICEVLA